MTIKHLMRRFATEEECGRWIERVRWPDGPVCPRCGVIDRASRITTRPGRFTCLDCKRRYSITSGTAMHGAKLPLRTWILAMYLVASSSKGISALKLAKGSQPRR